MAKKDEDKTPRLVQRPGGVKVDEKVEEDVTPSARKQYEAHPHDGIVGNEPAEDTATRSEQVKAFEEYQERSDIESRASILARETAAPGQFSEENVRSGSVDDGLTRDAGDVAPKKSKEAKKEAESIADVDALKGNDA